MGPGLIKWGLRPQLGAGAELLVFLDSLGVDMDHNDATVERPEPVVTPDSAFFWEGATRGELMVQQCSACRRLWHPPRPMCPTCHAIAMVTARMSGRGKVYSWAMPIHPFPFGFSTPP